MKKMTKLIQRDARKGDARKGDAVQKKEVQQFLIQLLRTPDVKHENSSVT